MNAQWIFGTPEQIVKVECKESSRSGWKVAILHSLIAAGGFHLAWLVPQLSCCSLLYAFYLVRLSNLPSHRSCFRFGLFTGLISFSPHLAWFWNIFGWVAICFWVILASFTGLFVLLVHHSSRHLVRQLLALTIPIMWTALEYFRSELYFLKFSWLSVGYIFSDGAGLIPVGTLGVYGVGFLVFLIAGVMSQLRSLQSVTVLVLVMIAFAALSNFPVSNAAPKGTASVKVAGIQLEFPPDLEVPRYLDRVIQKHPDARIVVLSEYSFDGPVPSRVRDWCRQNDRYLIAGGKDEIGSGEFYNTAFVISPTGEIVFKQGKSVPIQFFKDGLPAPGQEVWSSPWGRIAIPVCYDLSYRRVTDRFVTRGAQAFVVPFMDVTDWGRQQHTQHERIAPFRAREYHVPVFRLGSSGISQHVDSLGRVIATAEYPGQEQILAGTLRFSAAPRLPLDHWLAPACTLILCVFLIFWALRGLKEKIRGKALKI